MSFGHFFVDRPIFAGVLSILITLVGSLAYFGLPVSQYPDIAPPTIQVSARYPGASAETVSRTVATPLEQEINGVENMLYMLSQATADGNLTITITFKLGTDLDQAQVLVQNRVSIAEPRLPEEVRRLGVVTQKNSPDLMLVVNMYSPDSSYGQLYIANYAVLQVRDRLRRIEGVGEIRVFGASEYAMRIWIDPDRAAALGLTAGDILQALRAQNVQVAAGVINQPPAQGPGAYQVSVQTQGRLSDPEQFASIILRGDPGGRLIRVRDVARVELGAESYTTRGYLGTQPAVALPVFQRPGSNALETAAAIQDTMAELAAEFPPGLEYRIAYNPTNFIQDSINAVLKTIFEAVGLVVLVILVFLQAWRASLIPILAIPVSLIGTFAVMAAFGFSLNNLTLFGLVLAIGIVVDDAIVVVENVERALRDGKTPKAAAHQTLDEVGGALVATSLVLVAVFVPTAFLAGISGQFFQQFALTIAVATLISTLVSLTLSPAMAALLLKPHDPEARPGLLARTLGEFNRGLAALTRGYGRTTDALIRRGALVGLIYAGLLGLGGFVFTQVPGGFIPAQDQGYLIVSIQLPPGAKLDRTDRVVQDAARRLLEIDGIDTGVGFAGFSGATFTNAPNAAAIFAVLDDFKTRQDKGIGFAALLGRVRATMSEIDDAFIVVIPPPPVRGIGNAGGFKMMVQDRRSQGLDPLAQAATALAGAANGEPGLAQVFTLFETATPQLFMDIDRVRAEKLQVPVENIFQTLEVYFGSVFVNDFNYLGRTFQVTAQADAPFRATPDDLMRLRTRSETGALVPLGSVAKIRNDAGPYRVLRYNLYPAADIIGDTTAQTSSGEAIARMERLADAMLPRGFGYEWTELAYQQKQAGNTTLLIFALSTLFVFLVLAAQYESWLLPLAIILIVPTCLLAAMVGVWIGGLSNSILVQIGLVVLVGLASKNAILIVEFAKQLEDQGRDRLAAAQEAARLRLRPILMTSFAFILGVLPLVLATGAAAEMRRALGVTVFSGMLGVTLFGLLLTPSFYTVTRRLAGPAASSETRTDGQDQRIKG